MNKILLNILILCLCGLSPLSFQAVASTSFGVQVDKEINGRVLDPEGNPLIGVTVIIKGTTIGTVTDVNGEFRLIVPESAEQVVFSFVGFEAQEVEIGNQAYFEIKMNYEVGQLDYVVVTGYGQTQNEYLISSAITMIRPETLIRDRPISRLEGAIQGATPAVVILKESGSPGAPLTVRMRGVGTAGDATPLMLLDGFQIPDMNFVNPNDISGIGVYKDAAASSIYGARGGNGVLNTQSKNGDSSKPLSVSISTYYGVQSLATEGDYLNAREYAEYYNNSFNYMIRQGISVTGRGRVPFSDEEINRLPGDPWIRNVTDEASIQDYHASVSGGFGNTNYYFGTGIFDQNGIIGSTNFNRKTLNLKVNTTLANRVDLSVLGMYTKNKRNFIAENSENSRLLSSVASLPAIYPAYDESGANFFNTGLQGTLTYDGVVLNSIAEFGNPLVGLNHNENRSDANIYFINALASAELVEGIKLNTSYGYLSRANDIKQFSQRFDYPETQMQNPINTLGEVSITETYWQWEGYMSYDKKINTHSLSIVAGSSLLRNELLTKGRFGSDFSENTFGKIGFNNIIDESLITIATPYGQINTTVSYYTRTNYNYDERYLVGVTMRMDASSKFGPDYRWGTYPSLNFGWLLSNENFLNGVSFLNQLKLRASWGINGNDRIAPYQHYDRYAYNNAGVPEKQDFNRDVKWEEISQTNVGLDVDLLQNKIGITLDWYLKKSSDMLIGFPNPAFTGLPAPSRNAADVENKGFETIIMYRDEFFGDFSVDVNANIGFNQNELTSLNGGLPIFGASTRVFNGAPDLSISDVGSPIASFYGFKLESLDDAGNPVYADLGGPDGQPDGEITDEYDRTIIGNPYPDFVYGLNLTVGYKGFDLSAFVMGSEGNDVVNASTGFGFQYSNRTKRVLNAWSLENPDSKVMRPSALEVVNHEFSDYYVEDGSYLRVKNITLGYSLPEKVINQLKLTDFRVFVSANNLITLTDYSGYDPEIGANNDPRDVGVDRGFYPQAKSFIGGVQLSF